MKAIILKSPGKEDAASVLDCYQFNIAFEDELDTGGYIHCRKYLTTQCEHIDEFLDEEEGD